MVELGTVLGGKYRVDRVLGRGGMGVVAEVTHVQLGTTFAMKFLRSELAERQQVLDRFMREARAAAQLRGEHVCRVFDVSVIDGLPCLIMEKLEGTDLSALLKRQGPLPIAVACEYLLQVCAGMAEAHAAGFIHRDLKPGNLFLTTRSDGTPIIKILDFGVAKALAETDHDLTHSGMILGSPSYMSPEQIKASRLASARSDLWSIGVILYELVSGAKPFKGDGIAGLAYNISHEPYPALPNLPPQLDAVIARCLQKDPNLRFQSAGELAQALAQFVPQGAYSSRASGSVPSLPGRAGTGPTAADSINVTSDGTRYTSHGSVGGTRWTEHSGDASTIRAATGAIENAPVRARRMPLVLGGVACIAIGVGIAVAATRGGGDDVTPSAAPAASEPAAESPPESPPAPPPAAAVVEVDAGVVETTAASGSAGSAATEPKPAPTTPVKKTIKKPRKDVGESRI